MSQEKGKDMYTIGEVAKLKGLTVKTLRFYESIELLKPAYVDPANNYRYYEDKELALLDIIVAARSLDISPKALVPIIKKKNTNQLRQHIDNHKHAILNKIQELNNQYQQIEAIEDNFKISLETVEMKTPYYKNYDTRYLVQQEIENDLTPTYQDLVLNKIMKRITSQMMITTYESGLIISPTGRASHTFYIVKGENGDDQLPPGRYLCVNYTAKTVKKQQAKLRKQIKKDQLTPHLIVQTEKLNDLFDPDNTIFELQVFVD